MIKPDKLRWWVYSSKYAEEYPLLPTISYREFSYGTTKCISIRFLKWSFGVKWRIKDWINKFFERDKEVLSRFDEEIKKVKADEQD